MHRQPSTAFSLSRVGMYDNIAVSFLPNCESLSKNALEKGLNYFTQGYIHDIKISEALWLSLVYQIINYAQATLYRF
jgi:hypothetical protein